MRNIEQPCFAFICLIEGFLFYDGALNALCLPTSLLARRPDPAKIANRTDSLGQLELG